MDENKTPAEELPTTAPNSEVSTSDAPEATSGEHGIDDVKPVVNLVAEIANVSEDVIKGNYMALMNLIDEVAALDGVDFGNVLVQLKDVDTEESKELAEIFKKKFDLENDELELIIEQVIDSTEKTYLAVMSWVILSKRIKAVKK